MCFLPSLGIVCVGGGGLLNGMVRNQLMQFSTLCSSKVEVSETYFFDIVAAHNDHPSYVNRFSGSISVFSSYLGVRCSR